MEMWIALKGYNKVIIERTRCKDQSGLGIWEVYFSRWRINGVFYHGFKTDEWRLKGTNSDLNNLRGIRICKRIFAILCKVFQWLYKPYNNNLRTSSNSGTMTDRYHTKVFTAAKQVIGSVGAQMKRLYRTGNWKHLQFHVKILRGTLPERIQFNGTTIGNRYKTM
ncbi:hypothetical protein Tco_1402464 [Tanacetum coccineum]